MGFFTRYILALLVVFVAFGLIFSSLYSASTANDKVNMTLNTSYYDQLQNNTQQLEQTLQTDVSADPNDATDVASWFGKSLAIAAVVIQIIANAVLGSIQFFAGVFSVVGQLPAPWNILGQVIGLAIGGLAVYLVLKAFSALLKVDL